MRNTPGVLRPGVRDREEPLAEKQPRLQVFVHLAHGMDAERWNQRWRRGSLIGINEPYPYGYHRADPSLVTLEFSKDATHESGRRRLFRLGLRAILGFDIVHAFRNRRGIRRADAVWTHTESQHLAVLALLEIYRRLGRKRLPVVIAQSIWIFDRWRLGFDPRGFVWRKLMRKADVLTTHSPVNQRRAENFFPGSRVELVKFGICSDRMRAPRAPKKATRLSILSVGNDRDRDWRTLAAAVRGTREFSTTVISGTASRVWGWLDPNLAIRQVSRNAELLTYYARADVVVVPVRDNCHASGITVVLECVLQGLPVICADAGGLDAYFSSDEVSYYPVGDAKALRRLLRSRLADPAPFRAKAERAQRRLVADGLTSASFVEQHVMLSMKLLGRRVPPQVAIGPQTLGQSRARTSKPHRAWK